MDERGDDDEGNSGRPARLEENDETVRYLMSLEQQLANRSVDSEELVQYSVHLLLILNPL